MFKKPMIRYRIPRLNRKLASIRNSVRFRDAQSIGILYCSDSLEKHQAIKDLISEFETLGKSVDVLTYLEKGKDNHEFLFKYFTNKDFTFWGNVENDYIKSFTSQEFDFLFCLDFKTNLYQQYVLSMSNAKCRIGPYTNEEDPFFELMVKPRTKSIEDLIDSMKKYSTSLN